ncbi:MAG: ATP-binding protein [Slackia sp.]|uniref:sensor histidine kinase n=1 Tax=uncultured Slackia sp. TaxID=665903 RepID=UPI0028040D59|nr:ATP-binding protein [uncultured Slackia sp.]MDU6010872.1 ATP-binding protein [Slackia sp.]
MMRVRAGASEGDRIADGSPSRGRAQAPSLTRRIFAVTLIFSSAAVLIVSAMLLGVFYGAYEDEAENRLILQAREAAVLVNELSDADAADSTTSLVEGAGATFAGDSIRLMLIAADGRVLFDSSTDAAAMPNHADRPEFIEAREDGESTAQRVSSTLGVDTVYSAVLLDDGSVLRLSEDRRSFLAFFSAMLVPVAMFILATVACAFLLSRLLARRIMDPINDIDPSSMDVDGAYCEMEPLIARVRDQQEQLRIQNERLSRRDDTRREFSANVSHEMKTPLQVISGCAELMRDGMVPADRQREFAGKVYDEAQVMRRLVDDVLMLSKLDEPSLGGESKAPVDVSALAATVVGRLADEAAHRDVSLSYEGGSQVVPAYARSLEGAVQCLVENAMLYNRPGGSVSVRLFARDGSDGRGSIESGQVVIEVSDTGKGIPLEDQKHVFERFYRVEKSRSRETGGTGLGLAIVKHVAELHGGSVELESVPGVGSTFRLVIPDAPLELSGRDASSTDVG